jgi:serine/threonine-protein kinase
MLSRFIVPLSRFEKGDYLGGGAYGTVYRGTDKSNDQEVAIKYMNGPISPEIKDQVGFIRELEILAENDHPATLRLVGFTINRDPKVGPIIVTALMPNGTLQDAVKNERSGKATGLDATAKSICMFGIAAAMASVHSKGVLHRDLKPDNVLLTADNEPVVADFGISRYFDPGVEQTERRGTPLYMAPELMRDDDVGYSFPVDVFSFAMTLYFLFADMVKFDDGASPPKDSMNICLRIMKGARWVRPLEIPDYHWAVITKCWDNGPEMRPSFLQIVEEFYTRHLYILPGADREKVMAYERKVYRRFGEARAVTASARVLTETEAAEMEDRLEELLTRPILTRSRLGSPSLRRTRNSSII